MGMGIGFCDYCVNRKKNDENKENCEEVSPKNVLQSASGEDKANSPESRPSNKETGNSDIENISKLPGNFRSDNLSKIPHLSTKGDFIIKIYIESLEITYKLCDDFGSYFKPFIEIIFDDQRKVLHYTEEDKMNTSNLSDNLGNNSDMNNSFNVNNVSQIERCKTNMSSIGKEKYYPFRNEEVLFSGNSINSYYSICFTVKNDNTHSQLSSAHPYITIGEIHLPINMISQYEDSIFDGIIKVRLRNIQDIGRIKVKIHITEQNNASILPKHDLNSSFNLNNSHDMIMCKEVEWEEDLINYTDIDPNLIDKFFFRQNIKNKENHCISANRIIHEKIYDAKLLQKLYSEGVAEHNLLSIYQILNQLLKMAKYKDFNPINEFFKCLGGEESENFYKICELTNYNVFIAERFLMFIFYSQKYFKSNRSLTIRNNRFLNDTSLIDMIYTNVKKLIELYKQNSNDTIYCEEIRECCLWCLNNISELLTQPLSGKDDSEDVIKSEYTSIYNNCISVMSYRVCLLKLIDIYSTDSQLMSGLFRIFRKATQIITNDNTSQLDGSKIEGRPKDISKKFKNLLIEKYDGLFMYSLRLMLQKYQHYPELHVNILITIYQITNSLDFKTSIFAANKLGLKDFSDNFSIYKGRLRVFSKLLNNLHLNVLANFSEITKNREEIIKDSTMNEDYHTIIMEILSDLSSFYRIKKTNKKKIENFILTKSIEIDIHEIMARIYNNLTKENGLCRYILKEFSVFDDIIDFLSKLSGSNKTKENKEFILSIIEKKKKSNVDPKKSISNIVEYSLAAIKNILLSGPDYEEYSKFMANIKVNYNQNSFFELFEKCQKNLKNNQISSSKIDILITDLKQLVQNNWSCSI